MTVEELVEELMQYPLYRPVIINVNSMDVTYDDLEIVKVEQGGGPVVLIKAE